VQDEIQMEQVSPDLTNDAAKVSDRPIYDQVLTRTYRHRSSGDVVMLTLAYGRRQVQEFKIHRPELCYYSQGYDVRFIGRSLIELRPGLIVASNQLLTRNRARYEPVTYWIRIGDQIAMNAWDMRWLIFKDGISGSVPDGMLVRVSSLVNSESDSMSALELHKNFLSDLYQTLPATSRDVLAGS